MQREDLTALDSSVDVAQGDGIGRVCGTPASAGTALRRDDPGPAQLAQRPPDHDRIGLDAFGHPVGRHLMLSVALAPRVPSTNSQSSCAQPGLVRPAIPANSSLSCDNVSSSAARSSSA
ncbi:hypothetical protein GCM10023191_054130 [Actinoallomurus oryzae]|uniref:Uncharacterized protein n=1 Tax=Actinoallomurus oryzae TaxID=502180 RepID=A0ABP8QG53_9ACTN